MTGRLFIPAIVCLAAIAAAGGGAAFAQDEATPVRPFKLTNFSGELYVEGNLSRQNETTGNTQLRQFQAFFQEGLRLQGEGYIYHPNLCQLFGMVDLGLIQNDVVVNGVDTPGNGSLRNFNINALLPQGEAGLRPGVRVQQLEPDQQGVHHPGHGRPQPTSGARCTPRASSRCGCWLSGSSSTRAAIRGSTTRPRITCATRSPTGGVTTGPPSSSGTARTSTRPSPSPGGPTIPLPSVKDDVSLTTLQQFGPEKNPHRFTGQIRALERTGFFPEEGPGSQRGPGPESHLDAVDVLPGQLRPGHDREHG